MLTGMLAVRNLLYGEQNNLWRVNAEQEYHEEILLNQALNPEEVTHVVDKVLPDAFPKLDPLALGLSMGMVLGGGLMLATFFVLLQGGDVSGETLTLLNQFYPGYTVTAVGGLVGLAYAFITGFLLGWGYAFLRNAITALYVVSLYRSAQQSVMRQFFEHI